MKMRMEMKKVKLKLTKSFEPTDLDPMACDWKN